MAIFGSRRREDLLELNYTANVRAVFRQGSTNAEYLLHLYSLFQQFVQTPPSITTIEDTKTGKTRQNISFTTLALPCFNEFYGLFYANGIKIVPLRKQI